MNSKSLILGLIAFLFAFQAFSADLSTRRQWSDLEVSETYSLDRDLVLQVGNITLSKGLSVRLREMNDISEINVSLFTFDIPNCAYPTATTDILIVNPDQTKANDPSVGVKLEPGCSLEVFVESKDWYQNSLF